MALKLLALVFLVVLAACVAAKAVDYYGPVDFGSTIGREQGVLKSP